MIDFYNKYKNRGIELFLRLHDNEEEHWNNKNTGIPFNKVIRFLANGLHTCYFQKKQKDSKGDNNFRLLVKLNEDTFIEFIIKYKHIRIDEIDIRHSYLVNKMRVATVFNPPVDDTITVNALFRICYYNDRVGTNSHEFIELYRELSKLPVVSPDINKDKDKKVWNNYVTALKRLIKQKEQIWKIEKVGNTYSITNENDGERYAYLDMYISEKDLASQFEKELIDHYGKDELYEYDVDEEKGLLYFAGYREMENTEKEMLDEIAEQYFYELSDDTPTHSISGNIDFKYIEDRDKYDVYNSIISLVQEEYMIDDLEIESDGRIITDSKNIDHIRKCVEYRYPSILSINKSNKTVIKIKVNPNSEVYINEKELKDNLNELKLERAKYQISNNKKQVVIAVNAHMRRDILSELNLRQFRSTYRFQSDSRTVDTTIDVDGVYKYKDEYRVDNIIRNISDRDRIIEEIKKQSKDKNVKQLPTYYFYELIEEQDLDELRTFKTLTDVPNESSFNIASSELVIEANSREQYEMILSRVKNAYPKAEMENVDYNDNYYIQFETNQDVVRKDIINDIQKYLRDNKFLDVHYDYLKKGTRIFFNFVFEKERERDEFKKALSMACSAYLNILNFSYEVEAGITTYKFVKDTELEDKNENKIASEMRRATFQFLTDEERVNYLREVKAKGDDARSNGIKIGVFCRKDKAKITFRLDSNFEDNLNYGEYGRTSFNGLVGGFIKPIFPGDFANISRMVKAMKKVTDENRSQDLPNKNLPNFLFDPKCARISEIDIEDEKKIILSNLNEPLLRNQPKQLEAVAKALIARDMSIIQGPPGTGKTTVIAEIIWQTLLRDPNSKILITSQTNLAVDNALERLKGKHLVRPIRIGTQEKFEDEGKVYSYSRINEWNAARLSSEDEINSSDNAINNWIDSINRRVSNAPEYSDILKTWTEGLFKKDTSFKNMFTSEYLAHANVFAATCSECGSRNFSEAYNNMFNKDSESQGDPEFDLVIMDEASKATPPELVLPLTLGKKVVIIGDHKQLPPMIDEKEFGEALEAIGARNLVENWTSEDYKTSQFEKLFVNSPKEIVASLDTQFRMHEDIMNCISQFYKDQKELENGLICGIKNQMNDPNLDNKASRWHGLRLLPFIDEDIHAIWVNVSSEERVVGTSYENVGEVDAIKTVLNVLTKAEGFEDYMKHQIREEDKEIGIITYYMPQMKNIQKEIYPDFSLHYS